MPNEIEKQLERVFAITDDPAVHAGVAELADAVERRARSKRPLLTRFSTKTIIGALSVGAVGVLTATAAVAAPPLFDWLGYQPEASATLVLDSGITCEVGFIATPLYVEGIDSIAAVAIAQRYLENLDVAALPVESELARDAGWHSDGSTDEGDTSVRVALVLSRLINEGLVAELKDEGPHGIESAVSLEGGVNCFASADR